MQYLIENGVHHHVIFEGSKVMQMNIHSTLNMRCIDSLNFLKMKLAKLAKCFGLEEGKSDFPHFFNTSENWDYVGCYPSTAMYGIDSMSTADRAKFLEWYDTVKGKIFNFQKEIEHYCRRDVNIYSENLVLNSESL